MKIDLRKLYIGDIFINRIYITYINHVTGIDKDKINIFYVENLNRTLNYLPHEFDVFTYVNIKREDN